MSKYFRYSAFMGILVLAFIVFFTFFSATERYVQENIPKEHPATVFSAKYEIYDNNIYFLNVLPGSDGSTMSAGKSTSKLMKATLNDLNGNAIYTGTDEVIEIKLGGKYIYCFCERNTIVIIDAGSGEKLAEVPFSLNMFENFIQNDKVSCTLAHADSRGAYIVVNNEKQNFIVQIDSTGKFKTIAELNNMGGNIIGLQSSDEYLTWCYLDSDSEKYGTYSFLLQTKELKKISNLSKYGSEDLFPSFFWNNYYCAAITSKLYLRSPKTSNEIEKDLIYSSSCMCLDGNYVYMGGQYSLLRYNLLTGDLEKSNQKKDFRGKIMVKDGQIFLGHYVEAKESKYTTAIFVESLNTYKWDTLDKHV